MREIRKNRINSSLEEQLTRYRLRNAENSNEHHSYAAEQQMLNLLAESNVDALIRLVDDYPRTRLGTMAQSPVKQEEYTAVLAISFLVRVAIQGGVDSQKAYAINDLYLQQISVAGKIEQYRKITKDAIYQLSSELKRSRLEKGKSLHVIRAQQYINDHLNQKITLSEIADAVGVSPNYLSCVFSQAEQMTISEYLMKERIAAAENLLSFSEASISSIANFLCFSSQSHFGTVFRRYTHQTPSDYRKQHYIP